MDGLERRREAAEPLRHVVDPAGWRSRDLDASGAGIYHWRDHEIAEMAAAAAFEATGRDLTDIGPQDFPLPATKAKLAAIKDEIVNGVGFALVHGWPVQDYSRRRSAIAYLGLGTHFGRFLSQIADGHILGHVKDLGFSLDDPNYRANQTRDELDFHSDSCNLVGLFCLHEAKAGGASMIANSISVYNEMLKRRPELSAELVKMQYRDRRGEVPEGKKPYWTLPVYCYRDGYLSVFEGRKYCDSAQRFDGVPRQTPLQIEAWDLFEALCAELAHYQQFAPGDMQFLNNHVIQHARTEFHDWPEPERRRHLLRLWLEVDGIRPLIEEFREQTYGITIGDTPPSAPLDVE
jgi:hypothetical protein